MILQPTPALVEWYRLARLKLEHADSVSNRDPAVADLKRRVLGRLADLEAELARSFSLAPAAAEIGSLSERVVFMPHLSIAELEALEQAVEQIPPSKLD